jgi:hypothetical protein
MPKRHQGGKNPPLGLLPWFPPVSERRRLKTPLLYLSRTKWLERKRSYHGIKTSQKRATLL